MTEKIPPSAGQVRALAHQLMAWAEQLADKPMADILDLRASDTILCLAKVMRGERRLRSRIFPDAPLGNPSWDILLDLAIREIGGFRTSLDHLALNGEMPTAVAYEGFEALESYGLVTRTPDRFDARTIWVALSDQGKHGILELLHEVAELVRPCPGAHAAAG